MIPQIELRSFPVRRIKALFMFSYFRFIIEAAYVLDMKPLSFWPNLICRTVSSFAAAPAAPAAARFVPLTKEVHFGKRHDSATEGDQAGVRFLFCAGFLNLRARLDWIGSEWSRWFETPATYLSRGGRHLPQPIRRISRSLSIAWSVNARMKLTFLTPNWRRDGGTLLRVNFV